MPGNPPPLVIPPVPQDRGVFLWGGGSPDHRTLCVYLGILAEGYFESAKNQWAIYVDDPADLEWNVVDGHDVWIWVCGFCPRRKIRDVINAVDPFVEKLTVYDRLTQETISPLKFL